MKKILTIAAILALAIGLLVPATGWALTYNTADDVTITLNIPTIRVLDLGAGAKDVTFFEATAADLDAGFMVKNAATSFVVDSNDSSWSVTVRAGGDIVDGTNTIDATDLKFKSYEGDSAWSGSLGDFSTPSWTAVESDSAVTVVTGGAQVSDCQIIVDYKMLINWDTEPDAGSGYTVKLTYTLS